MQIGTQSSAGLSLSLPEAWLDTASSIDSRMV
jgi:hypothetical protein